MYFEFFGFVYSFYFFQIKSFGGLVVLLDLNSGQEVIFGIGFMHDKTSDGRQEEEYNSKLTPKLMI